MAKTDSPSDSPAVPSDDGYVVVARRYRPRGFEELVGQGHVGQALRNAIETSRVGHAYLFTGARGVGKTSTARIFAKALNNPGGASADFDHDSDIAAAIDAGEDVDVIEIDGASNRGIDEIRSLRANVGVRPSRARFKIYIIDEVHMLTQQAFNALLKTLEEPPEHVKFIFCTTDPEKIPITVLSRCQRFDFAPVEVTQIVGRLKEIIIGEKAEADDDALELIARRAAGSMRDSQSLLEQVMSFSDGKLTADTVHSMLGTADDERLLALSKTMADRDAATALAMLDQAIDAGVDAGRLAEQLLGYFRDLLTVTVGCDASLQRHTSVAMHEELRTLGQRWGLQTVLAVVGLIDETLVRIRHSVYGRVLLEATLIQICHLPDLQAVADLAAAGPAALAASKSGNAGGEKKKLANSSASLAPPTIATSPPATSTSQAPLQTSPPPSGDGPGTSTEGKAPTPQASLNTHAEPGLATVTSPQNEGEASNKASVVANPPGASATNSDAAASGSADLPATTPRPTVTSSEPWNGPAIESAWPQVMEALPEMTAAMVRISEKIDAGTNGVVKLVFPAESGMTLRRCDQAEHRDAIVDAVTTTCNQEVKIELVSAPPKPKPQAEKPTAPRVGRMQRMREIEANPLVQSCIEHFDAQIVKVDIPKN